MGNAIGRIVHKKGITERIIKAIAHMRKLGKIIGKSLAWMGDFEMTYDEAVKIAEIVSHADSGCPTCVGDLIEMLNVSFPKFKWERLDAKYDDEGEYTEEFKKYENYGTPVTVEEMAQ
jgi:hypothetical protein